jgi:hypothetical protein
LGVGKDSVVGASTLALDIIKNEGELGVEFQNVFVDGALGMEAILLIKCFQVLSINF